MPDQAITVLLTGSGVAGAFCVLFVLGLVFPRSVVTDLKAEIAELKGELRTQRDRADTAASGQTATRDIIAALREGLEMGTAARSREQGDDPRRRGR